MALRQPTQLRVQRQPPAPLAAGCTNRRDLPPGPLCQVLRATHVVAQAAAATAAPKLNGAKPTEKATTPMSIVFISAEVGTRRGRRVCDRAPLIQPGLIDALISRAPPCPRPAGCPLVQDRWPGRCGG